MVTWIAFAYVYKWQQGLECFISSLRRDTEERDVGLRHTSRLVIEFMNNLSDYM